MTADELVPLMKHLPSIFHPYALYLIALLEEVPVSLPCYAPTICSSGCIFHYRSCSKYRRIFRADRVLECSLLCGALRLDQPSFLLCARCDFVKTELHLNSPVSVVLMRKTHAQHRSCRSPASRSLLCSAMMARGCHRHLS